MVGLPFTRAWVIAIAVAEPEGGEPSPVGTIPNDTRLLLQKLKRLGGGIDQGLEVDAELRLEPFGLRAESSPQRFVGRAS